MIKLLTSKWMAPPIGAALYVGATVLFWKTPTLPPAPKTETISVQAKPSWDFTNPEAEQMMEELRLEKRAQDARQKQLDEAARSLDAERSEMAKVTQSVRKMQKDFDQIVLRVQDEEVSNLKRLAKIDSAMAPETAASIFAELDDSAIVKIMLFMKDADAAAIIESLAKKGQPEAKRAAAISERLRLSASHNPPANSTAK